MAIRDVLQAKYEDLRERWQQVPPERVTVYRCYNSDAADDHSFDEYTATQLNYGCFDCRPATQYLMLPESIRTHVVDPVTSVRPGVRCPHHQTGLLVPRCPKCDMPIDVDSRKPAVGLWGLSSAGKSVYCAGLWHEIQMRFFEELKITKSALFDRHQYGVDILQPLFEDGVVPEKNQEDKYRRLIVKVNRMDWGLSRHFALTDQAGEIYRELLDPAKDSPVMQKRRKPMLHTEEAILLASPETFPALGAKVRRDPYPILNTVLTVLQKAGAGIVPLLRDEHSLRTAFHAMEATLRGRDYMVPDAGTPVTSYRRLAEAMLRSLSIGAADPIVSTLDHALTVAITQLRQVPTPWEHIDEVHRFLSIWKGGNQKALDLRVAITVTKCDLLNGIAPDAAAFLGKLDKHSSRKEWHAALTALSVAGEKALLDNGEREFVKKARDCFREVGFFFVSGLGRDTETSIIKKSAAAEASTDDEGGAWPAKGPVATPFDAPTSAAVARWSARKLVVREKGGRAPVPVNVLSPLLWILTAR